MRIALAVLMALHGVAHTAGFATSWQIAPAGGVPYKTTVLGGRLDLGDTGIRAVGILWLAVAIAFAVTAVGTVLDTFWWQTAAAVTATASLVLSMLEMPQARVGVVVNVIILIALFLA